MAKQDQQKSPRRGIFGGKIGRREVTADPSREPVSSNPFDQFLDPSASPEELRQKAVHILELLFHRGQSRRADEQTWTIDQVVRELTGERYGAFVESYSFDEEFGTSHDWSTGKSPQ